MKIKIFFLINIIIVLFLSGCSSVQIHERLMIQGLGIDKENDHYIITAQVFPTYASIEEEGEGVELIISQGKSVFDAIQNMSEQTGKKPLYAQNLIVVIGKDLALQGIDNVMDFFVRYHESRPSVKLVISKTSAKDILSFKQDSKTIIAQDIVSLAESKKITSNVLSSDILDFISSLQSEISDPSTVCVDIKDFQGKSVITTDGQAVFNKDKLIGFLNKDETLGALIIGGGVSNITDVINIEDLGSVTYTLEKSFSDINSEIIDGKNQFDIMIKTDADLFEMDRNISNNLNQDILEIIKSSIEHRITYLCKSAINKSVFDYHSDIFSFGRIVSKQNTDYYKHLYGNGNLKEEILNTNYNIKTHVNIKGTGQEKSVS